ncbi:MAG: hypothetical protein IJ025_07600 [Clostridia bacterium]|nr:hypothetical protein [Clostridia bacterium]
MKNKILNIALLIIKILSTVLIFLHPFKNSFTVFMPFSISSNFSLLAYTYSSDFSGGFAILVIILLIAINFLWITSLFLLLYSLITKKSNKKVNIVLTVLLISDVVSLVVTGFIDLSKIIGILFNLTFIMAMLITGQSGGNLWLEKNL